MAEIVGRELAGGNRRQTLSLELYAARPVLVFRRGLLSSTTQPGRVILQRAARPSREGAFP